MTSETALAAPVVVGMMLMAAARARRRSLCEVENALVVGVGVDGGRSACWMPARSLSTLAAGARQLVVQLALLMMLCRPVVLVVVTPEHEGQVFTLGRGADDDLLGAGMDVQFGLLARGEDACALDDDIDAQVAPRQLARIAFGQHLMRSPSMTRSPS